MAEETRARILVLEDEWLIGDLVALMLVELGYDVVGPASNVTEALSLIERQAPDAALLDVSLGEAKSFAVADAMRRRGAPFLFLTGYVDGDLPEPYRANPIVTKPITVAGLKAPLETMVRHTRDAPAGL